MGKPILILVLVLFLGGGLYYFAYSQKQPAPPINISDWKTYQNQELGFSIKYPPNYSIAAKSIPSGTTWISTDFLRIVDPKDASTYEFHVIPGQIILSRQPVIYQGKVYHTISDYMQSGKFGSPGASNPKGELVTINGKEAVHYHFPQGDTAADASQDSYYFIKDDLIYEVSLNANDPYHEEILQSLNFQ